MQYGHSEVWVRFTGSKEPGLSRTLLVHSFEIEAICELHLACYLLVRDAIA